MKQYIYVVHSDICDEKCYRECENFDEALEYAKQCDPKCNPYIEEVELEQDLDTSMCSLTGNDKIVWRCPSTEKVQNLEALIDKSDICPNCKDDCEDELCINPVVAIDAIKEPTEKVVVAMEVKPEEVDEFYETFKDYLDSFEARSEENTFEQVYDALNESFDVVDKFEDEYEDENGSGSPEVQVASNCVTDTAREVMVSYQNANKWLDSVKESIYTKMNCPFFSSFVHELAHKMPGLFDDFGTILHTINMEIPYPETKEIARKPQTIQEAFDIIFGTLDAIKKALNDFIKCTDENYHGMSCAAEACLNTIEAEYPMLYRLQAKAKECGDDTVTFDKYVMQYVEHKDGLLENLNKDKINKNIDFKAMKEAMEENEDEAECAWCNDLFPKSEMIKDKDLGYLCDRCQRAIKSREGDVLEEATEKRITHKFTEQELNDSEIEPIELGIKNWDDEPLINGTGDYAIGKVYLISKENGKYCVLSGPDFDDAGYDIWDCDTEACFDNLNDLNNYVANLDLDYISYVKLNNANEAFLDKEETFDNLNEGVSDSYSYITTNEYKIINAPESAIKYNYFVVRLVDDEYWYYTGTNSLENAKEIVKNLKNSRIIYAKNTKYFDAPARSNNRTNEALHGKEEIDEFFWLCKELGLETLGDLQKFADDNKNRIILNNTIKKLGLTTTSDAFLKSLRDYWTEQPIKFPKNTLD